MWLTGPLAFLGLLFLASYPFGTNWLLYGVALFVAVLTGWWTRRHYTITVLERTERIVVFRMEQH
jgi:hypothetical protein